MKKKLVVLTGAGISAESGLSTFRDANGLWENHDIMEVASIDGYLRNPKLVQDFYNQRRKQLFEVEPNAAHFVDWNNEIKLGDLAEDGNQLRPHIVWFGEMVPEIENAIDEVLTADILMIIGTSMQVYPAASLKDYAKPNVPILYIDPSDSYTDSSIIHIKKKATESLDDLKTILNKF